MAALLSALLEWLSPILSRFVTILLFVTINKPIAHFASVVWTWVYLTTVRIYKPAALKIAQNVSDQYFNTEGEWGKFVADYINRFSGSSIKSEDIVAGGMGRTGAAVMQALGEQFLKPMLATVLPSPAEVEKDPLGAANRFMGISLEMNMSGWMLHLFSDMFSMGQFKALGALPGTISRSFGMSRLARFVLGPAFKVAIVDPMEKLFNRIYVPVGYTVTQASKLLREDLITTEDYINTCLNAGLAPDKAVKLFTLDERELSDAWLARLVRMGWIGQQEVEKELTRRGYATDRATVLARLILDDRKLDLVDKVIDAAGDLYRDGTLDQGKLTGYLQRAAYTQPEIDLYVILMDLKKSRRQFLTPAQIVQLWNNKKLGRAECKNYLVSKINFTPEDAELYMELKEKVP